MITLRPQNAGGSRRAVAAALALAAYLLTLGPVAPAAAVEIGTLNGNELSRVWQPLDTDKIRALRRWCSVDEPADKPSFKTMLATTHAVRPPESDGPFFLPWIDDGERVWGMSTTITALASGASYSPPHFSLYRLDRRRFNIAIADEAAAEKSYKPELDDWGVAGPLLPVEPEKQWRETGGMNACISYHMEAGQQYRRFERWDEGSNGAKLCRFALEGLGSQSVRLFVLSEPAPTAYQLWPAHDTRMLHIFDYTFRDVKPVPYSRDDFPPKHRWEGVWTKVASVRSPIVERFYVAKHPDGNFLITDEGLPYLSTWKKSGTAAELRPLTLRGGQLIQYVIHDADRAGRAFAFTTNYWFELQEPFEYREFDLGEIDVSNPMTTLLRCAKELRRLHPAVAKK